MKNQYATGPQHPDKLRDIFMAARTCDMLKHKARINEAKIIIRQALQLNIFIQVKTAIRQIAVQFTRQSNHRRRNIYADAFGEILRQSASQAPHATTEVERGGCFINANANSGSVAEYCFNLFAACGKKVFSGPLVIAFFGIGAYRPQRIGLRQSFPVSLQLFE
ncbi:MAG TPA: hypothetical protein VGK21_19240 [Candidatus Angelobacter sp.]